MITFQDTSFLKTENDVSFFLQSHEKEIPLFLNTDTERFYFQHLHYAFQQARVLNPVKEALITPFMVFVRYLLRSNLCFDIAFSIPIQQKQSKLALMYGDYFLARAGASFQPFTGYTLLGKLLVNTLKRIAKSQWLQTEPLVSRTAFYQIVSLRYGSVFQFCMKAPMLINHHFQDWKEENALQANAFSLYCTLLKNTPFTSIFDKRRSKTIELMKLQKFLPS